MLTQKESVQLLEILSAAPFEAAAGTFQRTFVRADHFRVAAALCLMLDDDVLRPHHRLTAMYVIHDLYKNELPSVHPFMPFLVNTLQQSPQTDAKEAQPAERKLLCLLLAQPPSSSVRSDRAGDSPPREPIDVHCFRRRALAVLPPVETGVGGRSEEKKKTSFCDLIWGEGGSMIPDEGVRAFFLNDPLLDIVLVVLLLDVALVLIRHVAVQEAQWVANIRRTLKDAVAETHQERPRPEQPSLREVEHLQQMLSTPEGTAK